MVNNPDNLKPCPFCGFSYDHEDDMIDIIYPTGTYWKTFERNGTTYKSYLSRDQRDIAEGKCWLVHCPEHAGGCGAEITGDSREEAIEKWNRRVNE